MWSWLFKNWKFEMSLCWQGQRQRCTWSRARWSESVLVAGPPALNITRKKLSMWRNVIWARTSIFQIILPIIVISTQYLRYWGDMVKNIEENGDMSRRPQYSKMCCRMSLLMRLFHCQRECCLWKWSSCQFSENAESLFWLISFDVMQCIMKKKTSITRKFDVKQLGL